MPFPLNSRRVPGRARAGRRILSLTSAAILAGLLLLCVGPSSLVPAQQPGARQRLPSPERIVDDYLRAVGGKRRVAAVRDAVYEWSVAREGAEPGRARTQLLRAPASARMDFAWGGAETSAAASARSAWVREGGLLRTLTDAEAGAARLRAALDAVRLVDFKNQNVLARTVGTEQANGEAAYVVEFSTRDGARLRYWFGAQSRLLRQIRDEAQRATTRFDDYRQVNGLLEPHRVEIEREGTPALILTLEATRRNTGLAPALFDPPPGAEALDVAALLREVMRNQDEMGERLSLYTYTERVTERKLNGRGEVTEETVKVYEVYPVPGRRPVRKLISENGRPLSPERVAREERRATEEITNAARAAERERARRRNASAEDDDDDPRFISLLLRASELVSPRRERFRDREMIVFDFRPRAGFRPSNRTENLVSRLAGVMWIDPADKQVARVEARFAQSFQIGGGLLASIRPGAAFVVEQARVADGVWLPRYSQAVGSARLLLFSGVEINQTREYSDYRRFGAEAGESTITAPEPSPPAAPPE